MKKIIYLITLNLILFNCKGQYKNMENKNNNDELIKYLYENYDHLDFNDDREELMQLDLNFDEISKDITLKYKGKDSVSYKLNSLNKTRKLFYGYALNQVKEEYIEYGISDGPYIVYLAEKKNEEVKKIIINILKDKNIPENNKRQISYLLENWNVFYYIQDSDGYTNLRKERNSKAEIIQQIKSGEKIEVMNNEGSWWLVKTKEGKQGYVYYDRIKIKK
jgi:uncharacterized protein YgiM (DUF1202 family)